MKRKYTERVKRYPVRFREDIGPYITIGGKRYPLDDSKYDPRLGADEVMDRFDKEYKADEAEKARKARRAELAAKAKDIAAENKKLLSGKSSYDDKFDALFGEYVPREGKSDSLGGEILRAVAKIGHRWNNDGDVFFVGYGKETCGEAAKFLVDLHTSIDDHEYLEDFYTLLHDFNDESIDNGMYYDPKSFDEYIYDKYDKFINEDLTKLAVDTVVNHPELFIEETEDMLDTKTSDNDFEEPTFDYWLEYPYDLDKFLDKGIITLSDIRSYVDDVLSYSSNLNFESIDYDAGHLEIYGLPYDDWTEFNDSWNRQDSFFDDYIRDLTAEYGDPDEYDEDEDDEEYDENDEE